MALRVQEAELREQPDVVIATPGRLVDHITNTHSFDLDSIEVGCLSVGSVCVCVCVWCS
jgi:ATP-dependent RNA helicase DDX27